MDIGVPRECGDEPVEVGRYEVCLECSPRVRG